jgi:hypothetical protein
MADQGNEYQDFSQPEVQQESEFRLYTPDDNRDSQLASHYDQELNEIISAPSIVYLLESKVGDTLYGEDVNPVYSPPYTGIIGFYQPNPVDYELSKWGIDAANIDMLIMFNKEEIDKNLPREIDVGDLVIDIYNRVYECTYAKNDNNFRFDFITEYVLCKRKLGDAPQHLLDRTSRRNLEDKGIKPQPDPLYGE